MTVGNPSSHTGCMVGRWNSSDQEMVDAPSINTFKGRLDR